MEKEKFHVHFWGVVGGVVVVGAGWYIFQQ